jgi:hypothetical protein
MKPSARADQLIRELLAEPRRFADTSGGYKLLQTYFKGAPLDTLRPLLRSAELHVQRVAASMVSELGALGRELLDDVLPLLDSGDRSLTFDAMESVAVCATGVRAPAYLHVVTKLEDPDEVLRSLSMFLMSNADVSQLVGARAVVEGGVHAAHKEGLRLLLNASAPDEEVLAFIHSHDPLRRRYGAVAAARRYEKNPRLIDEVRSMEDGEVRSFLNSVLRSRSGRRAIT